MGTLRLAHYIARHGGVSRRAAEKLVQNGAVTVKGLIVRDPARSVPVDGAEVQLNGELLGGDLPHLYIALHKPPGFLSSFIKGNENGHLLGEIVKLDRRLIPAGRLDRNSRGLLLLTTDGEWANRVMHPKFGKKKEYLVRIKGTNPRQALRKMKNASFQEQGRVFRADSVRQQGEHLVITLHEGRNRQIHRLAASVGLHVADLVRIRIGEVGLGRLKEGHWRRLTYKEVKSLRREPRG